MATLRFFSGFLLLWVMSCFGITVNGSDPNSSLYVIVPGQVSNGINFDGLGFLNSGSALCSGALLSPFAFLTAAHCITDSSGTALSTTTGTVTFDVPGAGSSALQTVGASQYYVNPGYSPDVVPSTGLRDFRHDVAIVILSSPAPVSVYYQIYRDAGHELDADSFTLAGYGYGATGAGYHAPPSYAPDPGLKREALNVYTRYFGPDGTETTSKAAFLTGAATNLEFSFTTTPGAIGAREGMIAPGDSGGPSFINGQIAGIHSQILCRADSSGRCLAADPFNVDAGSYGEFGLDTMVSLYGSWIDTVVAANSAASQPVPEPRTLGIFGACIAGLALRRGLQPKQRR